MRHDAYLLLISLLLAVSLVNAQIVPDLGEDFNFCHPVFERIPCLEVEFDFERSWACDGVNDCSDASDELLDYCLTIPCIDGYVKCPGGACVREVAVCSGVVPCPFDDPFDGECPDECSDVVCFNEGRCLVTVGGPVCVCIPGWTGEFCDVPSDSCTGVLCANNGNCVIRDEGPVCVCPQGWTGELCDEEIDECELAGNYLLCENGATCVDLFLDFMCICRLDYRGEFCEIKNDDCLSDPCINGGTCQDWVNAHLCVCPPGWGGDRCQIDIHVEPQPDRRIWAPLAAVGSVTVVTAGFTVYSAVSQGRAIASTLKKTKMLKKIKAHLEEGKEKLEKRKEKQKKEEEEKKKKEKEEEEKRKKEKREKRRAQRRAEKENEEESFRESNAHHGFVHTGNHTGNSSGAFIP